MKKSLSLLCALFCAAAASAAALFDNGKSDWQIVIPVKADAAEKYAADELQTFLKKISGVTLPVINSDTIAKKQIIIGSLATSPVIQQKAALLKLVKSNTEMVSVKTIDGALYLAGDVPRGALYAVYSF